MQTFLEDSKAGAVKQMDLPDPVGCTNITSHPCITASIAFT